MNTIKAKGHNARNEKGNILVLSSLCISGFVVSTLMALSFLSLLFVHNRTQDTADSLAIYASSKLNSRNRIGQMNTLVKRCPQLVFDSRQNCDCITLKKPQLSNFARDIMDETEFSALEIEKERLRLKDTIIVEAEKAVQQAFNERQAGYDLTLPWLEMHGAAITVAYGEVENTNSNVEFANAMPELSQYDRSQSRLTPLSGHFKGHLNATLPGQDSNLKFCIASLPSSVNGRFFPAHLSPSESFKSFQRSDEQIPSACQVELHVMVSGNHLPGTSSNEMVTSSTALTSGAIQE